MKKKAKPQVDYRDRQALVEFVNLVLSSAEFKFSGEEAIKFANLSVQIKDLVDKLQQLEEL